MEITPVLTNDGSHSLYVAELNEHYHSIHGAIQESQHVFIEAGLRNFQQQDTGVNLLEIGFGTGLNCLLTAKAADEWGINVAYTSLETVPLAEESWGALNYVERLDDKNLSTIYAAMHHATWANFVSITPALQLKKIEQGIQEVVLEDQFDLVYFDAFAPEKQPDMWKASVFGKIYEHLKPGGFLVTYCAKGVVKRTLRSVGFEVESLPGPPGKREMTKAIKK